MRQQGMSPLEKESNRLFQKKRKMSGKSCRFVEDGGLWRPCLPTTIYMRKKKQALPKSKNWYSIQTLKKNYELKIRGF